MASVSGLLATQSVIVRTFKSLVANPALTWSNSYEFDADTTLSGTTELETLAFKLVDFERAFHLVGTAFNKITVSTWVPDSQPYDPTSFFTINLNAGSVGTRASTADPLGLDQCLLVQKTVPLGRQGKLQYRGVLMESDVVATSGVTRLSSPSAMSTLLANAVTAGTLANYFQGGSAPLTMIMRSATNKRFVTALVAAGASTVKFNHRFFNRGGS